MKRQQLSTEFVWDFSAFGVEAFHRSIQRRVFASQCSVTTDSLPDRPLVTSSVGALSGKRKKKHIIPHENRDILSIYQTWQMLHVSYVIWYRSIQWIQYTSFVLLSRRTHQKVKWSYSLCWSIKCTKKCNQWGLTKRWVQHKRWTVSKPLQRKKLKPSIVSSKPSKPFFCSSLTLLNWDHFKKTTKKEPAKIGGEWFFRLVEKTSWSPKKWISKTSRKITPNGDSSPKIFPQRNFHQVSSPDGRSGMTRPCILPPWGCSLGPWLKILTLGFDLFGVL